MNEDDLNVYVELRKINKNLILIYKAINYLLFAVLSFAIIMMISCTQKPYNEIQVITTYNQTTTYTCWAASIATVYQHSYGSITPCEVANMADLYPSDCCDDMSKCNTRLFLSSISRVLDKLNVMYSEGNEMPTFEQFAKDIDNGVLYLAAHKVLYGTHSVVLYGYNRLEKSSKMFDPMPAEWPAYTDTKARKLRIYYDLLQHGSSKIQSQDNSGLPLFFVVKHYKIY